MFAYLDVFREEAPFFGNSTKEEIKNMNSAELESWSLAEDGDWCAQMAEALYSGKGTASHDTLYALSCLQQTAGKAKIIYYVRCDRAGFLRALDKATKDHNVLDSDEAWIIPFKNKGGIKLQYVPSIHAQYADWQLAKPDCSLYIRCWTVDELSSWMDSSPHAAVYPGADDAPVAADKETRMRLAMAGPRDYELAGVQVIKIQMSGGAICRTSFWHSIAELDEYAQNHSKKNSKLSPWGGFRSKTDPIEMYKKTARRIFIKNDAGPVMLRTKSIRG